MSQPELTSLEIRLDESVPHLFCDLEGQRAVLEFQLRGQLMRITHTGVPQALGGRGIAGQLTLAAFDLARQRGWKIQPACSYAAAWVQRHPEFQDLLA